jgi:hypothetical protein
MSDTLPALLIHPPSLNKSSSDTIVFEFSSTPG